MSRVEIEGLEELLSDLQSIVDLPNAVAEEMLGEKAKVVKAAHKRVIREKGLYRSGQLAASIEADPKIKTSGLERYMEVYPKGTRAGQRTRYRSRNGREVTNAEVGFINEYGAPGRGIPASGWMKEANEACEDEANEAAVEVYDRWLRENNL